MPKPVSIVTGASRGIGRAIATELSRTHQVIGTYKSDRASADSLASETGADIVQCDVSSAVGRAALIRYARERYESLDLLVNNAGIAPRQRRDVLEASEESFDELMATNLKGPHFLTALAATWMLERGAGRIVFITSISAYAASVNRAEYCISKAGLSMSAAIYAQRLAAHGIQVFEVRPGIIRTDMTAAVEQVYTTRIASGLLPQPRMGTGADVARAVRAIADGCLDYSTGQVIDVDGGFHLRSL